MPIGHTLHGIGDAQEQRLRERAAHELKGDGKAVRRESRRTLTDGIPRKLAGRLLRDIVWTRGMSSARAGSPRRSSELASHTGACEDRRDRIPLRRTRARSRGRAICASR